MSSTDPEDNLTPSELENLDRLEVAAQRGWGAYVALGNALAEIRDRQLFRETHATFEEYLRERWGQDSDLLESALAVTGRQSGPSAEPRSLPTVRVQPCESLVKVCERTLSALGGEESVAVEIRVTVSKQGDSAELVDGSPPRQRPVAKLVDDELLPRLRLLLSQASGTIADVAHDLETRAADIEDGARAKLRDDVLVLDDELTTVKALLVGAIDWNSELEWLLRGEIPPFEGDDDGPSADDDQR
ncbi:MAG TPA: hypothetical protein VEF89_29925 [Solirubrobacteraceae bacterium]|nr:hypothetical protein [Solirubrobacteraceae bacterium]